MLPGVGIFGSDPVTKVLIQILKHFDFEINAIWTNHYELDAHGAALASGGRKNTNESATANKSLNSKLITTSIDNVLLNKSVNLIFVCCQPNLHSQISTKALGIGKNVICLFPTCKSVDDIQQMINSARYYPSLLSSVSYGGLKYLSEFKLVKQSLPLIGDLKVCTVNVYCQNLTLARNNLYKTLLKQQQQQSSTGNNESFTTNNTQPTSSSSALANLIDHITSMAAASNSSHSLNWLMDKDLGAGVLNRFGAAMISLLLSLFDERKVTRVYGNLKTFVDDLDSAEPQPSEQQRRKSASNIRKITSDDYCSFQLNLEPGSVLVNACVNSLGQCRYSQEIVLAGTRGVLTWRNSKITFRSLNPKAATSSSLLDSNNNQTSTSATHTNHFQLNDAGSLETELTVNEPIDKNAEIFLNSYKNVEDKHPELPLMYIRGLYHYLENIKREFVDSVKQKAGSQTSGYSSPSASKNLKAPNGNSTTLENFEHTRVVQLIVQKISISSKENRWVTVNY